MSRRISYIPVPRQILFLEQCADLLENGVPVVPALQALQEYFPEIAGVLVVHLSGGSALSDAMSAVSPAFDPLVPFFIRFGEKSGALADAVREAKGSLQQRSAALDVLKKNAIYPLLVLAAALVSLFLVSRYLFPVIAGLFSASGVPVPVLFRWGMLFGSDLSLAVCVLTGCGLFFFRAALWRTLCSRSRPVARVVQTFLRWRFLQYTAVLLRSGCSLQECMALQRSFAQDALFRERCVRIAYGLSTGAPFARAVERELGPGALVSIILRSAEHSGDLVRGLERSAALVEKDIQLRIERVLRWMGPVLTLCMGAVVAGVIAVAFYPLTTIMLSL